MNIRKGLFRLWIVTTIVWTLFSFVNEWPFWYRVDLPEIFVAYDTVNRNVVEVDSDYQSKNPEYTEVILLDNNVFLFTTVNDDWMDDSTAEILSR